MAVKAIVVSPVRPMPHDDVFVLGRDDDNAISVVTDRRRFVFLVADVAVEIRGIGTGGGKKLDCRYSGGGIAEKIRVHQGNSGQRRLATPKIEMKRGCQR